MIKSGLIQLSLPKTEQRGNCRNKRGHGTKHIPISEAGKGTDTLLQEIFSLLISVPGRTKPGMKLRNCARPYHRKDAEYARSTIW
jgi:hypothetical protein